MFQINRTKIIILSGVMVGVGLAAAIFFWNNFQIQISARTKKPIELPPMLSNTCGMENCHGLDIRCGVNTVETCDMSYQLGDNCRQFVSCQVIDGSCQMVKSQAFDTCKSCVSSCLGQFENDPSGMFDCESKCMSGFGENNE